MIDHKRHPAERPLLKVEDLSVRFGGITAVSGVSFEILPGQIVGFIGPNGAGKTTLLNAISKLVDSTGRIELQGQPIDRVTAHKLRALGMARSFQTPQLEPGITVAENIAAGLAYRHSYGLWSAGLRLPSMRKREAAIQRAVQATGQEFQIGDWLLRHARDVPNGIQKTADVVRAVMGKPRLVLLDEPFAGLSAEEKTQLTAALSARRSDDGLTVLVIDHDIDVMVRFCDRLCAMSDGQLKITGTPTEVVANPTVMNSYLGLSTDMEGP